MKANKIQSTQVMFQEVMQGLKALQAINQKMDFRQLQTVWLRGIGKTHAPRQERRHKLKIVTHLGKGGKQESFTHIQAFYDDGRVLAITGDVYHVRKEGGMYTAHVEYIKTGKNSEGKDTYSLTDCPNMF